MSAIPKNLASLASLLKEGSNHYRGLEEVVYRNIDAAKQLSKVVRTSMGPNGTWLVGWLVYLLALAVVVSHAQGPGPPRSRWRVCLQA